MPIFFFENLFSQMSIKMAPEIISFSCQKHTETYHFFRGVSLCFNSSFYGKFLWIWANCCHKKAHRNICVCLAKIMVSSCFVSMFHMAIGDVIYAKYNRFFFSSPTFKFLYSCEILAFF